MTSPAASSAPIGVFDSGLGGLSILRELRAEFPNEEFIYLADTAHCPYGSRAEDDIRELTLRAVSWLRAQGTKAAVIACNTACAFSLASLRGWAGEGYPIIGLVPALKPAVERTRSGVVGVFATPVTLRGSLLQEVTQRFAEPAGVRVLPASHPRLVPLVEAGLVDAPETHAILREVLSPLAGAGMDQLVLGCTHYPFLTGAIRAEFGDAFALLDSGAAVARQTRRVLEGRGLLNAQGAPGQVQFFSTGDPDAAQPVLSRLSGQDVAVQHATSSSPALQRMS